MASAYLNPTQAFLRALLVVSHVHFLTAGHLSHGFKPKGNTAPSGRTRWVPALFDTLARWLAGSLPWSTLWYYQRPDWTFHAKGLWISDPSTKTSSQPFAMDTPLHVVTHGSGNYGHRSAVRDMESNLILILQDDDSALATSFRNEWNAWESPYGRIAATEQVQLLPFYIRWLLPFVRWFL